MSIFTRKGTSIDELKYNFDSGARPNRFDANFFLPNSFSNDVLTESKLMGVRLESCQLPGRELEVKSFSEYGQVRQMPTGTIDGSGGSMDFTFRCDQHFADRLIIEAWQQIVFSSAPSTMKKDVEGNVIGTTNDETGSVLNPSMSWYDDYIGKVEIIQHRLDGKKALKVNLYEAYPIKFEPQELNRGTSDEIMKFTCTIAFRNWESEYVAAPERSALNKGRVILDSLLEGGKILDRFGKGGKFNKTLSNLDTRTTQINNLFGGGG